VTEERVRAAAGPEVVRGETAGTPWRRYTALLRQLDEVRAAEESRTAARRASNAAMSTEVARLEPVLAEQGGQISDLARRLGLRAPRLTAAAANGVTEPAEALRRAMQSAEMAAEQARAAERRARQAALLPRWRPGARNLVIYLFWALVGLALQFGSFALASDVNRVSGARVLFLIPACAFVAGLVTVSTLGRVRILPEPAPRRYGQPPPPNPNRRSIRMGLLVCFLTFPVFYVFLLISNHLG